MKKELKLKIIEYWLTAMHNQNIPYCHFKSNEHLGDALLGNTDLDVLIDRKSYAETIELLNKYGFKRFQTASSIHYPAVEDYLGFDESTGKLVHLHLHWQMIAGEPNLKGFRLPWEQQILEQRVFDKTHEIYTSSSEHELILLLTRAALKLRFRDKIKHYLLRKPYFKGGMLREFEWLKQKTNINKTAEISRLFFDTRVASVVINLIEKENISDRDIFTFRKAAWPSLKQYRTYGSFTAHYLRWKREVFKYTTLLKKKILGTTRVLRRGPATGGLIVALLGVDGSGKSTHSKDLVKWLGWKADVKLLYLGSGDGPKSFTRKIMTLAGKNLSRLKSKIPGKTVKKPEAIVDVKSKKDNPTRLFNHSPFHIKLWNSIYSLLLAREKHKKLRAAYRARNKGMILVADRYPQNQIMGYNDGPLLNDFRNSSWPWSWFYKKEARLYKKMLALQPDLVLKLEVSAETARERKKDTPTDMIQRKIEAVKQLTFEEESKVITVDANRPLEEVSLKVKQAIWNCL